MPHPLRVEANGRPVYFVFVIIFIDDVSANVSKLWNKHFVCYMSNGCLPREHIDKEFNVRFVATSPSVGPLELMQGIQESFECVILFNSNILRVVLSLLSEASRPGVSAYDCVLGTECLVRPIPYFWAADNPMQAEQCSHRGLTANKFCRTCTAGGTQEFKRSEEGYLSLFEVSNISVLKILVTYTDKKIFTKSAPFCNPEETRNSIKEQFMRALAPNSRTAVDKMAQLVGVKDTIAQPIIEYFTQLSNELWTNRTPGQTQTTIRDLLNQELTRMKASGPVQNPLLEMSGKSR